jgi:GTPase
MLILPPEKHDGNIEYKWRLVGLDNVSLERKMTQVQYRLDEGSGEAIYYIGVMDDGTLAYLDEKDYNESVNNLQNICQRLDLCCQLVRQITEENSLRKSAEFVIRKNLKNVFLDLKIGVIGNVDCGKSTLVGVLCTGAPDDGRGDARNRVFNFKHEIDSGRTSSISHQILGFDHQGQTIVNRKNWSMVINDSVKIVTFYDLAGHEKYLKTTIYGLSCSLPDYAFVVVGGNQGVSSMTLEHISLCLALQIPFIILVTKIDIAPENVLKENMRTMNKMIRKNIQKIPYRIKTFEDVYTAVKNIKSASIVPIFQISNVTKASLDLVLGFLNLLPIRNVYSKVIHLPIELWIDSHFQITGHGTVVCGLLTQGTVKKYDNVLLGPFGNGEFQSTRIKSIHVKQRDVKEASAGMYVCVALKNINRSLLRKGMVVLDEKNSCQVFTEFFAKINILQSHHTTIKVGYKPCLHIGQVRQCASILEIKKENPLSIDDNVLRTGDSAIVKMRFLKHPEYIKKDMKLVFRDGRMKAVGTVIP